MNIGRIESLSADGRIQDVYGSPHADLRVVEQEVSEWPAPMAQAAFCGLAGDFVRLVGPQTEADPAGLLAIFSLLQVCSSAVKRGQKPTVEGTIQTNLPYWRGKPAPEGKVQQAQERWR
jgi:hypothetical protein